MLFEVPVLMIAFNRPDTTREVFKVVKKVKPKKLFVAIDGPRSGNRYDKEKCMQVKEIFEGIDWDCEVKTLYREGNMGCHKAVPDSISWFFKYVDFGIILEDDCLPDISFFRFCEELLSTYKNNEKVMMVTGDNFLSVKKFTNDSYFFSKYAFIWGWATWKRAWLKYDDHMSSYTNFSHSGNMTSSFSNIIERFFWRTAFNNKYYGYREGWDTKWIYALISNGGISVIPNNNLITNIGMRADATTTKGFDKNMYVESSSISFPLNHPNSLYRNTKFDKLVFKKVFLSEVTIKSVLNNYIHIISCKKDGI